MNIITQIYIYIYYTVFWKNSSPPSSHLDSFCWNYLFHTLKGVHSHLEVKLPDTRLDTATCGTRGHLLMSCAVEAELRCSPCLSSQNPFAPLVLQIPLWYNFVPHIMHSSIFQFSLTAQYAKISNHTFHLFSLICVV